MSERFKNVCERTRGGREPQRQQHTRGWDHKCRGRAYPICIRARGRKGPAGGGFTATGKVEEEHFGPYFLLTAFRADRHHVCVAVRWVSFPSFLTCLRLVHARGEGVTGRGGRCSEVGLEAPEGAARSRGHRTPASSLLSPVPPPPACCASFSAVGGPSLVDPVALLSSGYFSKCFTYFN